MRNGITITLVGIISAAAIGLLVWNRLESAPAPQAISVIRTTQEDPTSICPQPDPTRQQLFSCGDFIEYRVNDSTVALTPDAVVTVDGEHLRFDTGRIVVKGKTLLTVRDVAVQTDGTVTLVHYSWLNTLDVKVLEGSAAVRQGEYSTTVTEGNAVSIDTLTPYEVIAPTTFNIDAASVKEFYDWAIEGIRPVYTPAALP